jgi:hypothetical protein
MSHIFSEYMSGRRPVPDETPDRMPEYLSDRMPEGIPKCT